MGTPLSFFFLKEKEAKRTFVRFAAFIAVQFLWIDKVFARRIFLPSFKLGNNIKGGGVRGRRPRRAGGRVVPPILQQKSSDVNCQEKIREKQVNLRYFSFSIPRDCDILVLNITVGGLAVKNKVTVTIAGRDYTLLAAEDDGYVQRVAAYVDDQVKQVVDSAHVSLMDGALLAATNIADAYFKERESAENLRRQLKEYLDEATRTKLELSEAKREIFKLQNKK